MADDARSLLLRSARERFHEKGFAATSMEEIRLAASVSNGSLFHHFPTKTHLARALYLEALRDYHRTVAEVLRDSNQSTGAAVEAMIETHIDWVSKNRSEAFVLVELRRDAGEIDFKSVNAEVFGELHAWIRARVAKGDLEDLPFDVFMALVFAPVLQLTARWARPNPPKITSSIRKVLSRAARRAVEKKRGT